TARRRRAATRRRRRAARRRGDAARGYRWHGTAYRHRRCRARPDIVATARCDAHARRRSGRWLQRGCVAALLHVAAEPGRRRPALEVTGAIGGLHRGAAAQVLRPAVAAVGHALLRVASRAARARRGPVETALAAVARRLRRRTAARCLQCRPAARSGTLLQPVLPAAAHAGPWQRGAART